MSFGVYETLKTTMVFFWMIPVETTDKPNREWSKFKQDLPLLDQSASGFQNLS